MGGRMDCDIVMFVSFGMGRSEGEVRGSGGGALGLAMRWMIMTSSVCPMPSGILTNHWDDGRSLFLQMLD